MEEESHQNPGRNSRRIFLTRAGVLLAGTLLLRGSEFQETYKQLPDLVVMIDSVPGFFRRSGFRSLRVRPITTEALLRQNVGEYYPPRRLLIELAEDTGLTVLDLLGNEERRNKALVGFYRRRPELLESILAYRLQEHHANHGYNVAAAMNRALHRLGYQIQPHILPMQNLIGEVRITDDSDSNREVSFEIDDSSLITLLMRYPKQKIVNLSFEVGRVGVRVVDYVEQIDQSILNGFRAVVNEDKGEVYIGVVNIRTTQDGVIYVDKDGNEVEPITLEQYEQLRREAVERATQKVELEEPKIEIFGAYETYDEAMTNIRRLYKICSEFPDKLFVVAIGNNNEDLSRVQVDLADEKPDNVIIVGAWTQREYPRGETHGADIYVRPYELGLLNAASFATPVIAGIAARILHMNPQFEPKDIISYLEELTDIIQYRRWSRATQMYFDDTARILSLEKMERLV